MDFFAWVDEEFDFPVDLFAIFVGDFLVTFSANYLFSLWANQPSSGSLSSC